MNDNTEYAKNIQGVSTFKTQRSSNLELYRIVCMLMIVAHHYVVNSGVRAEGSPMLDDPTSIKSVFLFLFGAWGKTGINCFLMITGYFMCTSKITLRKFVKLMSQIYFYKFLLYPILFIAGYETLSFVRVVKLLMPAWGINQNFTSCFIVFWLTIPFLNILVHNMNKQQHQFLLILLLVMYTFLGSIPSFNVTFNYVTWFGIIYFIASYIRIYPNPIFNHTKLWKYMTLISIFLAMLSVYLFNYAFVADSNKFFAVVVAVCSFLWFKNMNIRYSKIINAFGAGTFGVLLIHANSNAMRTWLWKDSVDVIGHYSLPFPQLILYSMGGVISVFVVCNLIDQLRIATLEKWFLNWYDNKISVKADKYVNRIIQLNYE